MSRLSTTYSTDSGPGLTAADRASNELFQRARRHSKRVRMLRFLIPIILAASLALATLAVMFNPLRLLGDLPVTIGRISVSQKGVTMTEPELSGYTRDKRRYELSANSAAQDLRNVDLVNLDEPRASIEMSDRTLISMQAAAGMYNRKEGVLTLDRNILLSSTAGYEIRLERAVIDVRNGNIVSDRPVEMFSQHGTLRGNRLEVTKSGEIVRLEGDVVLNFTPPPEESAPKAPPQ